MPDVYLVIDGVPCWLELKVIKKNRVRIAESQIAWHLSHNRCGGASFFLLREGQRLRSCIGLRIALRSASRATNGRNLSARLRWPISLRPCDLRLWKLWAYQKDGAPKERRRLLMRFENDVSGLAVPSTGRNPHTASPAFLFGTDQAFTLYRLRQFFAVRAVGQIGTIRPANPESVRVPRSRAE